jgi:hypothetical protein
MIELYSKIGKKKDHTGRRFGMLVALRLAENANNGGARWYCRCDCGDEKVVTADNLIRGKANSCGCTSNQFRSAKCSTHGHSRANKGGASRTYISWNSARQRCENPKRKYYEYYGGRGIAFCDRWKKFENFLADMGECPSGRTLDRIDTNGNYEPSNCQWSTSREQALNRRKKIKIFDVDGLLNAADEVVSCDDYKSLVIAIEKLKSALNEFRAGRI